MSGFDGLWNWTIPAALPSLFSAKHSYSPKSSSDVTFSMYRMVSYVAPSIRFRTVLNFLLLYREEDDDDATIDDDDDEYFARIVPSRCQVIRGSGELSKRHLSIPRSPILEAYLNSCGDLLISGATVKYKHYGIRMGCKILMN